MPFFTEAATSPGRVLAPLGLEAVGQRIIAQHVFPGITGGLVHPQYFSFMSWVVASYEDAKRGGRYNGSFVDWRRRLEHAWRICSLFRDADVVGLIGIRRTELLHELRESAPVDISDEVSAHAFQAATYGASFGLIGLGEHAARRGWRVTAAGRMIADAFETALRAGMDDKARRVLTKLLAGATTLRVEELRALSEHLHLRTLVPSEPEHAPVAAALVTAQNGYAPTRRNAQRRARGFGLLLSVIEAREPDIASGEELLEVLWMSSTDDGTADFSEIREAWRCYGERQEVKTGLVAFWHVILRQIERDQPFAVPGDDITRRCIDALRRSVALAEYNATAIGTVSWASFVEGVCAGRKYGQKAMRRQRFDLVHETRRGDEDQGAPERLGNALVLLAASAGCWSADSRSQQDGVCRLHGGFGGGRITLPWLSRQLDDRRTQSVAEVAEWLVRRCILQQALIVGNAKTPYGTKLVVTQEGGGFTLVRGVPAADPFDFDANRLTGAVAMLRGLSLINTTGPWSLTATGRQTLRACKAVAASDVA